MRLRYLVTLILGLLAAPGYAQQVGDTTVWSGVSTFGLSLEGGYQITPDWRARAGLMGGLNVTETQEQDGNSYDVDAQLGGVAMMLDYSPSGANWRMSGGLLVSRTTIETTVRGNAQDPIEYNGQSFNAGTATSIAEFNRSVAPVVTVGYDYPLGDRWIMSSEIGGVFIGGLDVEITGDSAALQDAIDNDEDVQKSRADAGDLSLYPYVSVSVGYKF
jgi:hypothetical protein